MFKDMIAPMQAWLLSQGRCVGCGKPLTKKSGKVLERIDCVCGRVYMYDPNSNIFRRANINEIK